MNNELKSVKPAKQAQPTIYNNTVDSREFYLTLEEIERRPLIGIVKNNWRQRTVKLYAGAAAGMAYMVGRTFDGSEIIVSHEALGGNEHTAIDYWQHGQKTYVRD